MKLLNKPLFMLAMAASIALFAGAVAFLISPEKIAETLVAEEKATAVSEPIRKEEVVPPVPVGPEIVVHPGVIGKGDTVSSILSPWLSAADIYALARISKPAFSLTRIRKGQPYRVVTKDGLFDRFEYEINDNEFLAVRAEGAEFAAELKPIAYETKTERVEGRINSSLYLAVSQVGERPALAVRLADMFGWEVDFIRDIREGDKFSVLVEKRFRDGEWKGYGRILAASFTNQGDRYEGFLYPDSDGKSEYYTAEGKSLRRAFLKAPLSFKRISSNFSLKRFHPVLKRYRPHYGVDYAAPTGTPISTVGDGVVTKVARGKGAGKYVKVRHKNGYESAYLHMSRFARGMKKGKKVKQGDVIGYVGSTGYSTGPHLDFRMKKNGSYVNPRKATNPRALPIPKAKLAEFRQSIHEYQQQLSPSVALGTQNVPNSATDTDS